MSEELIEIEKLLVLKGEEIRQLKLNKATKEVLQPHIDELLKLKERYQVANNGIPYAPPTTSNTTQEKKKETKPTPEPVVRDGPSKKELNRQKKKEQKEQKESGATSTTSTTTTESNNEQKVEKVTTTTTVTTSSVEGPQIVFHPSVLPQVSNAVLAISGVNVPAVASTQKESHQPYLSSPQHGSISGDYSIARFFARQYSPSLLSNDSWLASQIDQWIDHSIIVNTLSSPVTLTETLPILENHLKDKTFLVGTSLTLADLSILDLLQRGSYSSSSTFPSVDRWFNLVSSSTPSTNSAELKAKAGKAAKAAKAKPKKETNENEDTCPELEGAIEGQVVTRFPPEPSGYLHIGHTKAALLNQYYAQRYKGKLIIRFDDTNPSKEKEEYEQNIIRDLATLQIKGDIVTHTSDSFDICERYAVELIQKGLAYMDDTDQEKMQAERLARVESYRRNSPPAENLVLFQNLLKGDKDAIKFCLRAKIDMNSTNGTMRDPVLYRYNDTPHHRTGTKYKAYPTYDFACPIVDSIEGVTNALRTTEYNDRDEQYHWLQNAMGLRKVHILAYGKINFVHTVLSKRKLTWFVDNGHVDGWNDPRFPTIQGCIRRGMQVESLKNFIISQGASRRVINMEWDKFWSENKKILEDISPRYMAVTNNTKVLFTVTNIPNEVEGVLINVHPSKPELGQRIVRKYNKIYLEGDDCQLFSEGEEVTLVRWGNFFIDRIERDDNGKVLSLEGRFNPDATNFSKTKKATWIAAIEDLVPCQLVEFDHLISKPKLNEEDNFQDFITPVSRAETRALGDPYLRTIQVGQVIQLERKGFFRCDQPYGGVDKPAVFFLIPDGRVKAMSTLSSALSHR